MLNWVPKKHRKRPAQSDARPVDVTSFSSVLPPKPSPNPKPAPQSQVSLRQQPVGLDALVLFEV